MNQEKIDRCVEMLSLQGCTAVLAIICQLEAGLSLPETAELTADESRAVLEELKTIMAVYGERKGSSKPQPD
jgi:hypothetical protein